MADQIEGLLTDEARKDIALIKEFALDLRMAIENAKELQTQITAIKQTMDSVEAFVDKTNT